MPRIRQVKTTFTAGEVSRSLLGRADLRAYENGALTLRNVYIQPTGGVKRRAGLAYIDTAHGDGRLIPFEFNTEQTALLVVTHERVDIYVNDVLAVTLDAPWTLAQLAQVAWTQSADTLLVVHPDVPPKKIVRSADGTWSIADWSYITEGNVRRQPYYKFAAPDVTLDPSGTTGSVTVTASQGVFDLGHIGTRLRVKGKETEITDVASPTVATITVIETLANADATTDWQEQAFSPVRGYPVSVAFHQDRLVIGGSRDLPNRLWFSRSGDLFNFDLGTGLDDEAIEFGILSDQINAIRGIFSGRDLQVFTSGAEWIAEGDPLTPKSVQIKRQTRIGSVIGRYIPPLNVDGATLFVARSGRELREFLFTDLEQAYSATDLAILSRHIVKYPLDQDYDARQRLLFMVREDGLFATLTSFRSEQVIAWTLHDTQGLARSVTVVGESVYMLVDRDGVFTIEVFEDELNLDSALRGHEETPATVWSGLDHLEGKMVSIIADGVLQSPRLVSGGTITIDEAARDITVGLPFTHTIEPLPPSMLDQGGSSRTIRLVEAVFRVEDTAALRLDVGRGLRDMPLRALNGSPLLDAAMEPIDGDIRVRALGWQTDNTKPLWRIEQDVPLPFNLLSVSMELKIND